MKIFIRFNAITKSSSQSAAKSYEMITVMMVDSDGVGNVEYDDGD